ncbi:MAG TPA: FAD-dependent monooxygenase [Caulobacteraceae bacterium]|nr:FAD-dependent monooxygenase [Caulobacteraceae bacterium]
MADLAAEVVVVGAGMAGATAALALASGGLEVALLEGAPFEVLTAPTFDGRASAISAAAFRQWRVLGVADKLATEAQPIRQILVTDGRGAGPASGAPASAFLRFHADEESVEPGEPLGFMVENRHIRAALAQTVLGSRISVIAPARAAHVETAAGPIAITLEDGRRIETQLLVAADGRTSRIRGQLGIGVYGWSYSQTSLVATLAVERDHGGVAYEHFLPSGPFAILPLTNRRVSLVWTERARLAKAAAQAADELFEALVRRRFGPFLGRLTLAGPRFAYPLSLQLAESLVGPRTALVGDAGHAIHPIAGQGLNMGLKDAAALAEVVIEAARLGEDIGSDAVLARYARWRRLDNLAVAASTDLFNRLYSTDRRPARLARTAAMAAVNATGPVRRLFQREAAGASGDLPRLLKGEAV